VFKHAISKQIFVGALLGLFYYLLQLAIRPEPYVSFTHNAGKFLGSIATGIVIYMILYFLNVKKNSK
jgi:hypothetical protein